MKTAADAVMESLGSKNEASEGQIFRDLQKALKKAVDDLAKIWDGDREQAAEGIQEWFHKEADLS